MSILWCGGEDIDFSSPGSVTSTTSYNGTPMRSDFARCAVSSGEVFVYGVPVLDTPVTSCWMSFQGRVTDFGSGKNLRVCGMVDSASGKGIYVGANPSAQTYLSINKYDGSTVTSLAAESTATLDGSVHKFDLQIIDHGATATVNLYKDGSLAATYSGSTEISGVDSFNAVGMANVVIYGSCVSEIIVADEDTRLLSVRTASPSAAGDTTEWEGAYTDIDEVTLSDADVISTDTADEDFQCNLTGMPAGDYIVKAVKVAARCTDGIGGMGIKIGIKTNSDVDLSDAITLGGYWETKERLYNENPITSNRFTPAEIDALQIALQSVEV